MYTNKVKLQHLLCISQIIALWNISAFFFSFFLRASVSSVSNVLTSPLVIFQNCKKNVKHILAKVLNDVDGR